MVRLRELTSSDVAALHEVYGNQEATRHLSFRVKTEEQVQGIVRAAIAAPTVEPRTEYMLAVVGKDDELIGSARLATGSIRVPRSGSRSGPTSWARGRAWSLSGDMAPAAD
jgi:ribosomal-protein-alanine N-acetyltransferase